MLQYLYDRQHRHATWLELFFDLVFVAVLGVVAHDLAHTHEGHISLEQLLKFALVFIPVWWIWMGHTLFANIYDRDDRQHRVITLLIMACIVVLSIFSKKVLAGDFVWFVLVYFVIRLFIAGLYLLELASGQPHHRAIILPKAGMITVGAMISLSAVWLPDNYKYLLFYGGILLDMLGQLWIRKSNKRHSKTDLRHFVERMGLLSIIILGESVIVMVASLPEATGDSRGIFSAAVSFVLLGAVWWIYFDSFPMLERARRLVSGNVLIYSHLLLCTGLLILANLIQHAILNDLDRATFSLFAISGLSLFYLGKQIPYWVGFPPWRLRILLNTVICIGCTVFSVLLADIAQALVGMTVGMLVYVWMTLRYVVTVDVSEYLLKE